MARIYEFLPSVLILAFIFGATFVYLKLIVAWFGENNLNSIQWAARNKGKIFLTIRMPFLYLFEPALEEFIFRVPIIIAFSSVSSSAWYGIFVSGGLFALMHWSGNKLLPWEILSVQKEKGKLKSDNLMAEVDQANATLRKTVIARRMLHVFFSFWAGILFGYYGIEYQSVWVPFGIHAVWNLIMPFLLPLLVALVLFIPFYIVLLWHHVSWWLKRYRRLKRYRKRLKRYRKRLKRYRKRLKR